MADLTTSIQEGFALLRRRIARLERLETSVSTLAIAFTTFATLPSPSLEGQVRKCTNCRKGAETAGNGTGCLVYWDVAQAKWLRVYDNAAASA